MASLSSDLSNAMLPALVALFIGVVLPLAMASSIAAVFYRIAGSPLYPLGLAAIHGVGAGAISCAVIPFVLWIGERGLRSAADELHFVVSIVCLVIVAVFAFLAAVLTVRKTNSHQPALSQPHYVVTSLVTGIALCGILYLGIILVLLYEQLFIRGNPGELQGYENALAWAVLMVWPPFLLPSLIGALMGRFVGWRTENF